MRKEIVISMHPENWELIKTGKKTIDIRKTRPDKIFFPFRVYVYVTGGVGVVGTFICNQITTTIRPEQFAGKRKSCMTEEELKRYANGKFICGWYVQKGSVIEYETAFPIKMATGLKYPPMSWQYIDGGEET